MAKHPNRPRDPAQLAKMIVDIATGELEEKQESPATVKASRAGRSGGPARAKALTPAQRSKIASLAAAARWKKG